MIQALRESRATTAAGGVFSGTAIISFLLPHDVKNGCLTAVQNSDNPLFVAALLTAGLAFTIIGPSLAKKKP